MLFFFSKKILKIEDFNCKYGALGRGTLPEWQSESTLQGSSTALQKYNGALGRDRTCDPRFRRPVLFQLSYECIFFGQLAVIIGKREIVQNFLNFQERKYTQKNFSNMKKSLIILLPILLCSCTAKTAPDKAYISPSMSSENTINTEKNTTTKPTHKAQKSTAVPETKEATKELDALFEEIAGNK